MSVSYWRLIKSPLTRCQWRRKNQYLEVSVNRTYSHALPTRSRQLVCLMGCILLLVGCNSREAPKLLEFDFQREVAPIFNARCISCHGPNQQQGGLRLDEKVQALQGGLSGKSLAGKSLEDSELIRRVTTDDLAILMPKEGGRLPEQEIETLKLWVKLGTPWPDQRPPSGMSEFASRYSEDLWKRLSVVGREIKIYLLMLFAIGIGIGDRIRRIPADDARWSRSLRRRVWLASQHVSVTLLLVGILSGLLWDVVEFSMRQSAILATTEIKLRNAVTPSHMAILTGTSPQPIRIPGAPQLGGTYYRGNDERSEKLFNGGLYRTATLRLSLIDEADRPVQLKELLPGSQLFIRLEIDRASQSTPSLFTDAIMQDVLLTRRTSDRKEPLPSDTPTKLDVLESGERWVAKYRLGEYDNQSDAALNGTVYVETNAKQIGEAVNGSMHYGIVYGLRIRDRVLMENSELWLGPILVPGNFQIPDPKKITLQEWLDIRPIPEIDGDNSTDPDLLGIPEHLNKKKRGEVPAPQ